MRPIKFRAWDKYGEVMYHDVVNGIYCDPDEILGFDQILSLAQYEVMQYTGLKDKNGREIYEGDILRTCEDDQHIPERESGGGIIGYATKQGFSQIGTVHFEEGSFSYKTRRTLSGRHEDINIPVDWLESYEVIGNKFDNPELLEGETSD